MSQKIKKQIKRSMPWFMIISLVISSVAMGFVFNFDLNVYKNLNKRLNLTFTRPEAKADMATTTVSVRNAPPSFSTQAFESPSSTTTSPVNVGSAINFRATADDPEGNNYYLIVCSSASVTARNGQSPLCGALQFCVSGSTIDETEANCTYENVTDPGAESRQWYAYACDVHASQADCSVVSQGVNPNIDNGSSPFYVNHAPGFTALGTIDNYKDPGGTFVIEASSTDPDVARGAEILHLYACQTNSWATSTGCAVPLCHATSTSPDVTCSFATSTPAADGNYTYYGFVMDNFNMPSAANSRNNTYTVNNVAPVVGTVLVEGGFDLRLNIKGAPGKVASTSSQSVTDNNGCQDLINATSSIYWSSASGGYSCDQNYNNCYQMGVSACHQAAGSCTGSSDIDAVYTCTTTIEFLAIPTDGSAGNPNAGTNWRGSITAYDGQFYGASTSPTGIEIITTTALEVTEPFIDYGIIQAGHDSGTTTATTTIKNYGNSPLNSYLYGSNMTSGVNTLAINQQEWSLTAYFTYGSGTDGTSIQPGTLADTDIARPTSTSTDALDYIYWGINIPLGTLSGDYTGTSTFTAALDGGGVGW